MTWRIQSIGRSNGVSFYTAWIKSDMPMVKYEFSEPLTGKAAARKCPHCGHHEIGIEDSDGRFSALKPGMEVEARRGERLKIYPVKSA